MHKFGLEFDLLTTTNSPNAVNALVGGSVNVAGDHARLRLAGAGQGPRRQAAVAVADGTPYVLLAQPEIKKVADLKGKTTRCLGPAGGADTTASRSCSPRPA